MTSETDAEFVERMAQELDYGLASFADRRLFAPARRGAAVDEHAVGFREGAAHMHKAQAAEIERLRREKDCTQDAFNQQSDLALEYVLELNEAAAEIERLRAALRDLLRLVEEDPEEDDPSPYLFDQVCDRARAALKDKP